jgi:hypothetical protein
MEGKRVQLHCKDRVREREREMRNGGRSVSERERQLEKGFSRQKHKAGV